MYIESTMVKVAMVASFVKNYANIAHTVKNQPFLYTIINRERQKYKKK